MTRETKVGLIVACSFLVLVGIVIASKLRSGDDSSEQQEPTELAAISPQPDKKDAKPTEPAKKIETGAPAPVQNSKPTLPLTNMQAPVVDPLKNELEKQVEQAKNQGQGGLFLPPPVPMTNANETPSFPPTQNAPTVEKAQPFPPFDVANLPGAFDQLPKKDVAPPPPTPLPEKKNVTPSFPALPAQKNQSEATLQLPPNKEATPTFPALPVGPKKDDFPLIPLEPKKDGTPSFPPLANGQNTTPTFPALPAPKKEESNLPPVTNKGSDGLPTFPMPKKDGQIATPGPFSLPPEVQKEPSIAPLTNREQPVFPGTAKEVVPTFPPAPVDNPIAKKDIFAPAPVTINANDFTKPGVATPLPETPPRPVPTIGGADLPTLPTLNNNAIPTIGGGAKSLVTAVEHNLKMTDSRLGETTYAQISTRLYGTDKYAEALYAYNRTHGNPNLSPTISPNQNVLYPATPEYLAREYPNMIRTATPPTIPPTLQNPAVRLGVPPATTIPQTPTPPVIATVSNPPMGQGRSYVVQSPNGERIRDIAQRALGNADRWTEIYRINQNMNLQPQFPLPAGTRLQLPAN